MIWKTRKMSGGLTRRAQDHGDVEKGDPECAGWTSPKTQTLCYPTWIHSSGSAFKRSPCWTSTTQKCLSSRASQEKKERKKKYSDRPKNRCAARRRTWTIQSEKMWESLGKASPPSLLVCASFSALWSPSLSLPLPTWARAFQQNFSSKLAPGEHMELINSVSPSCVQYRNYKKTATKDRAVERECSACTSLLTRAPSLT